MSYKSGYSFAWRSLYFADVAAWLVLVSTLTLTVFAWRMSLQQLAQHDQTVPMILALGGTALAIFSFILVRTLARQRDNAQQDSTAKTHALHDSDNRFRRMVDASPNAMVVVDASGRIRVTNAQTESLFQYSREALLGKNVEILVPQRYHSAHIQHRKTFMDARQTRAMGIGKELYGQRKDGSEVAIEVSLNPIDLAGESMVLAVVIDISARLRTQHAMEKLASIAPTHDVYDAIAEALASALNVRWCGIGQFVDNGNRVRVIGFSDAGSVGARFEYDFAGTPCADACITNDAFTVEQGVAERYPNDILLTRHNVVSYRGDALRDTDGRLIGVLFAMDTTPCSENSADRTLMRLAARRATMELIRSNHIEDLRLSEQRWQFALESSGDGVWDWNTVTNKVFFSHRWKQMLGYNDDEVSNDLSEWSSRVHPDDLAQCYEDVGRHMRGETAIYQNEHRVLCKDGSYKWILDRGKVVERSSDRKPLRMIGTHADLSAQKNSEQQRERLQRQLQQAQKMEAIGQLTGGIAHDFNNILASVLGYTELLREKLTDNAPEKIISYLNQVQIAGERARDLVAKMLSFARGASLEPRILDPRPLLRDTLNMLSPTIPSSISVQLELDEFVAQIRVDPTGLYQIIANLVINARDAMDGKGTIRVGLHQAGAHDAACSACGENQLGTYVAISVSDTGIGMSPEILARIFDPFFTTKEVGKGTGLGLSVIHGIMHDIDGHILAESIPGRGTTFRLLFPAQLPTANDTDNRDPAVTRVNIHAETIQ